MKPALPLLQAARPAECGAAVPASATPGAARASPASALPALLPQSAHPMVAHAVRETSHREDPLRPAASMPHICCWQHPEKLASLKPCLPASPYPCPHHPACPNPGDVVCGNICINPTTQCCVSQAVGITCPPPQSCSGDGGTCGKRVARSGDLLQTASTCTPPTCRCVCCSLSAIVLAGLVCGVTPITFQLSTNNYCQGFDFTEKSCFQPPFTNPSTDLLNPKPTASEVFNAQGVSDPAYTDLAVKVSSAHALRQQACTSSCSALPGCPTCWAGRATLGAKLSQSAPCAHITLAG